MKKLILVRRYSQGLVNALRDEREFQTLSGELKEFVESTRGQEELTKVLSSPFVVKNKRIRIIKEILGKKGYQEKTKNFILLLLEHDRLNILDEVISILPVLWNEKKGITTFEVSSVVPLTEEQKERLQDRLELLEKRQVRLDFRIEPDLLGGLCLRKGNLIYDISLQGNLLRLKEKIIQGS